MNIFKEVLNDVQQVEQNLIGPAYPYDQNIKPPNQVGMSTTGTSAALSSNINGLRQYVDLLVSGNSSASATGGPLGNKFFMQTGGKCLDNATNQEVDRYIYINNVPTGAIGNMNIDLSGMGGLNGGFQGLIPGALQDLNVLNPYALMQSFLLPNPPPCQEITMETINSDNITGSESQFVTIVDIQNMDPCTFPNGTNPVTGAVCGEGFSQRDKKKYSKKNKNKDNKDNKNNKNKGNDNSCPLPKDTAAQIYFTGLACLGIFIFYKIMKKSH
jgi:hypothetical protein